MSSNHRRRWAVCLDGVPVLNRSTPDAAWRLLRDLRAVIGPDGLTVEPVTVRNSHGGNYLSLERR